MYFAEWRKFQRCSNLICKVFVSTDEIKWNEVGLCNISAGGIKVSSKEMYELGQHLYFNLYIYNMLSEFIIRVEGEILRVEEGAYTNSFGIKFVDFDKYHQIQLDEVIRSRISRNNALQEEMYACMMLPSAKYKGVKARMGL